jgi:hypothetical protein
VRQDVVRQRWWEGHAAVGAVDSNCSNPVVETYRTVLVHLRHTNILRSHFQFALDRLDRKGIH